MKKRRKLLVMLLAFSVFASSFVSSNATNTGATAADPHDISDKVVTSIDAENITPSTNYQTTVKLNYAENSGVDINGGDYIKVTWTTQTDNDMVYMYGLEEQLSCTIDNNEVGTAVITKDDATITFNDNINNMNNVAGFLEFTLNGYNGNTGPNTSSANINSGNINKVVTIYFDAAGTDVSFYSKVGTIWNTGYVNWWLNVCDQGSKCTSNVVIVDEIQGGQTLEVTSFNISIAKASTPMAVYQRFELEKFKSESGATVETTENTIKITIPQAYVKDKMIQIGYRTKITQKNRPIFHNNSKATYTLTGEEPITSIDNIEVKNTSANTGITGTKQGELKILKVITGTETPIEGVKFVLKRKDNTQINNATSLILTTDKDGIAIVTNLPEGEYSFKETYAPEWVKFDPNSATSNTFTILSDATEGIYKMVENPIKTVDITVAKKWWGTNTKSKSATINLLADGIKVDSITKIGSKWEYIFKDMPKYDTKTGKTIEYTVTEEPIEGYKSVVGDNKELKKFFVTNTELMDIKVTKVWVGKAGTSATVNLFVVYNTKSSQIESFILSKDNNWTHTFKDLPTNFHGEHYSYYVTEDQIDGYKSERTWSKENGFTFTNTQDGYVPSPDPIPLPPDPKPPLPLPSPNPDPIITPSLETVSIPVIKNWVGKVGSGADMRLLANGTEIQKITLNEVNQWKHIFADLPKYDKTTGREIVYTLSEVPVDGYNTVITGDSKIGFTVTNTTTDKVSVGVTKQWVGKAKASIIVNLFADGKKIESKALSKDNGWQHTFTNLPQYKDGKKIKYTISEDEITGYDVRITGDVNSGFIIENTEVEKLLNNYKDIENPKTGDPSNLFGYGVLLIMAGMGVILVTRRKNKSK